MYTGLKESQIIPKSQLAQFLKEVNVSTCVSEEAFPVPIWIFMSEILKSDFYFKLNLTYKPNFPNQFIIILTADIINTLTETT